MRSILALTLKVNRYTTYLCDNPNLHLCKILYKNITTPQKFMLKYFLFRRISMCDESVNLRNYEGMSKIIRPFAITHL